MDDDPRCEGCQTDTCFTPWPDDDPHMPGRMRGCFAGNARSVDLGAGFGPELTGKPKQVEAGPWEKSKAVERRPGGFEMPMIASGKSGTLSRAQYERDRAKYDDVRHRLRNDPNVLK